MISERIIRLSEKVRDTPVTLCLDRARLITDFYSRPSMEPFMVRRARSFEYVLDNKQIFRDSRTPCFKISCGAAVPRYDGLAQR